jgi:hypothetical protein
MTKYLLVLELHFRPDRDGVLFSKVPKHIPTPMLRPAPHSIRVAGVQPYFSIAVSAAENASSVRSSRNGVTDT